MPAIPSSRGACFTDGVVTTALTNLQSIGWIWVGKRGNPMATRLVEAGHRLVICDPVAENHASLVTLTRPSAPHVGLRDLVWSPPPPHQPCPDVSGTAEPAEFHLSPISDWNGRAVRRLSKCAFRADCTKDNAIANIAPEKPASAQRRKSNHSPTPLGMPPRRDWPSQTTRTARKTAARPPVNATGAVRPAKAFPPDPFHTAKDHP